MHRWRDWAHSHCGPADTGQSVYDDFKSWQRPNTLPKEMTMSLYQSRFMAVWVLALLALLALPLTAHAKCFTNLNGETLCAPAGSRCVKDRYGTWFCSSPGGDAALNRTGTPVCGAGRCVADIHGEIMCSTEPRGSAALDIYIKAVCTSGCAPALAENCQPLTKLVR
jgi:hypothetical protein